MSKKHKRPTSPLHRPKVYWVAPVANDGEENQSHVPRMATMERGKYNGWAIHDGGDLLVTKSTKRQIMREFKNIFPGCELTEVSGGRFYCKVKLVA